MRTRWEIRLKTGSYAAPRRTNQAGRVGRTGALTRGTAGTERLLTGVISSYFPGDKLLLLREANAQPQQRHTTCFRLLPSQRERRRYVAATCLGFILAVPPFVTTVNNPKAKTIQQRASLWFYWRCAIGDVLIAAVWGRYACSCCCGFYVPSMERSSRSVSR